MIHLLTLNELYNINHTGYSESASKLVNIVKEFDFLKA